MLISIHSFTAIIFILGTSADNIMNIDVETVVYVVATINVGIALLVLYRIFKLSENNISNIELLEDRVMEKFNK